MSYKTVDVGYFEAELFVNECAIVEIKVAWEYQKFKDAQLVNELKATGITVGILIDFGRTKVEFQRLVF